MYETVALIKVRADECAQGMIDFINNNIRPNIQSGDLETVDEEMAFAVNILNMIEQFKQKVETSHDQLNVQFQEPSLKTDSSFWGGNTSGDPVKIIVYLNETAGEALLNDIYDTLGKVKDDISTALLTITMTATTVNASSQLTVVGMSTEDWGILENGMTVKGPDIPDETVISSFNEGAQTIDMDKAATDDNTAETYTASRTDTEYHGNLETTNKDLNRMHDILNGVIKSDFVSGKSKYRDIQVA